MKKTTRRASRTNFEHIEQHIAHMSCRLEDIDHKLNLLLARVSGAKQAEIDKLEAQLKTPTDELNAAVKENTPTL